MLHSGRPHTRVSALEQVLAISELYNALGTGSVRFGGIMSFPSLPNGEPLDIDGKPLL